MSVARCGAPQEDNRLIPQRGEPRCSLVAGHAGQHRLVRNLGRGRLTSSRGWTNHRFERRDPDWLRRKSGEKRAERKAALKAKHRPEQPKERTVKASAPTESLSWEQGPKRLWSRPGLKMARKSWEGLAFIYREGDEIVKFHPPEYHCLTVIALDEGALEFYSTKYTPTAGDLLARDWFVVS